MKGARGWLAPVAGISAGWIAFCVLVWLYGESPRDLAPELLHGTWGTSYGIGQVLFKATPILVTGIAVDLALRGGLFNIGAEGQLAVASVVAASVGARLPAGTPLVLGVPLAMAAAMAAGALWALPPAVMRARLGTHEVITTIMMNRVADGVVGFALGAGLAMKDTVRTPDVVAGARAPRLEVLADAFRGSAVSVAFPLALLAVGAHAWSLRRTRFGRELSLIGMSPAPLAAEGVPVRRYMARALLLSGAVAGGASVATVLGYKGYFEEGLGAGAGFGGVAVALLGRGSPIGLVAAALLFGTLQQGGLVLNGHVPKELMDVLQGVIVCAVALSDARVRARLRLA
ncbi:MAG: hypothetical protein R3B36_29040 [Polyangiaceae bacterium]